MFFSNEWDYQVIEARDTAELTKLVLAARDDGWQLAGGMSSYIHTVPYRETHEPGIGILASGGNSYNVFCQAMTRYEK